MARTLLEPATFMLRPDPRWSGLLRASLLPPPLLVAGWLLWHHGLAVGTVPPALPVLPLLTALSALAGQLFLVRRMLRELPSGQIVQLQPPTHSHPDWHLDGRPGEPLWRRARLTASYFHFYFPSNAAATAALFLP